MVPCWTAWSSTDRKEPQQKGTGTLEVLTAVGTLLSFASPVTLGISAAKMRCRWRKGDRKRGDKRRQRLRRQCYIITYMEREPSNPGAEMFFEDRGDAGRQLAERLARYKEDCPVVFALPRGGVPIGAEISRSLQARLE